MPLPANCTLPLLGHSLPGDTISSRPKQAMIVRMSAETIEALETFPNHPQIDFQFGANPGIYIGDIFFPMRSAKEGTPNDLYLRASSAAKKMPPLKLCANIIGKFTVERQLDDGIRDKVRGSTIDAANQRSQRGAIILDTPLNIPPRQPSAKKKKEIQSNSKLFRNPVRPADQVHAGTSTAINGASTGSASPAPTKSSARDGFIPLRKRMVHCIAISERTAEQTVRLVGGQDCSAQTRQDLMELLEELAEPVAASKNDKSPKLYRLKLVSWQEVRPYEWPKLTENERTNMSRLGRLALKQLDIPESDPLWVHMRYRSAASTKLNGATPQAAPIAGPSRPSKEIGKAEAPKRGVSSKEAKEKKTKPKADRNAQIMMKDESVRSAQPLSQTNGKVTDGDSSSVRTLSTTVAAAAARKPGSGFRVSKSGTQGSNTNPVDENGSSSGTQNKSASASQLDPQLVSLPTKISIPSSAAIRNQPILASTQRVGKLRIDDPAFESDRDKRGREREREEWIRQRARKREKEDGEHSEEDSPPVSSVPKRKKPLNDADEDQTVARAASIKRRKLEGPSNNLKTVASKVEDSERTSEPLSWTQSRAKKQEPVSMSRVLPKIRKEGRKGALSSDSIPSPTSQTTTHTSANGSKPGKNNVTKVKRRSPVYTSSEEEGLQNASALRLAAAVSLTNGNHSRSASSATATSHTSSARASRGLPTDRASLRALYTTCYSDYLKTYHQLYVQKSKIDAILTKPETGHSDSDGDADILDAEELLRLTEEHRRYVEKLETIRQLF